MPSTICVIAQLAGENCSGTRLAYRSTSIVWPSLTFTPFIAAEQLFKLFRLQARWRLPRAELGFLQDAVGRVAAQAVERVDEKLPNRAGVGLLDQLAEHFLGDMLHGGLAAVGDADFDLKRIAAIDGRRPRRGGVKLAGHDLMQALENQLLADRARCNRSPAAAIRVA